MASQCGGAGQSRTELGWTRGWTRGQGPPAAQPQLLSLERLAQVWGPATAAGQQPERARAPKPALAPSRHPPSSPPARPPAAPPVWQLGLEGGEVARLAAHQPLLKLTLLLSQHVARVVYASVKLCRTCIWESMLNMQLRSNAGAGAAERQARGKERQAPQSAKLIYNICISHGPGAPRARRPPPHCPQP